ncbi:MAG: transglutaminase domain-containing protein [Phycisphaerae bacterium]|nr:transglutaminase domain-containing protein [Phycisphaerae bacterium]
MTSHEGKAYHVRYVYRLTNKLDRELKDVRVYIPIPETSPRQEIRSLEIVVPDASCEKRTVTDQYGQKLCRIVVPRLGPKAATEVGFDCEAVLRPRPRVRLDRARAGGLDDVPPEIRKLYTKNVKYVYDLDKEEIQQTSARLVRPHENLLDKVMAIHDFVAQMEYKRDGRWDSACVVLGRKNGSCSEFTYLFCALCRAAGIPTRFAGGTCYRRKKGQAGPVEDTVYHRWSELYLPPYGWVPFDVTRDRAVRGGKPKRDCVGAGPDNVLILMHGAGGSRCLGNEYVGSNSQPLAIKRERTFLWTRKAASSAQRSGNRPRSSRFVSE